MKQFLSIVLESFEMSSAIYSVDCPQWNKQARITTEHNPKYHQFDNGIPKSISRQRVFTRSGTNITNSGTEYREQSPFFESFEQSERARRSLGSNSPEPISLGRKQFERSGIQLIGHFDFTSIWNNEVIQDEKQCGEVYLRNRAPNIQSMRYR